MAEIDIGKRLKAVREARGLSQRQLAQRAGVTNGQISMIEQNKISPSVSSLKKILDGVPMGLSDFFADGAAQTPKTFYRRDELVDIGTPAFCGPEATVTKLSLLRVGPPGSHSLMMLQEIYEPGADTGQRLYSHDGEEAGIVVEGRIEITVGDELETLGPGDAYIFESRRPHRFRNPGNERCTLISACTPPTF
ncbi:cupin domain-containing protein [Pontitalea aquivivens]|uniref:cupin domain-containing protein n=1 Tax=Pontitalea aquivivens TaxID=3388663 RepID=UPI0039707A2C